MCWLMSTEALQAAVAAVPREVFLQPGVFLPTDDGRWRPATPSDLGPAAWAELAYSDEQSLVTQLDGHVTVDDVTAPIGGSPTACSTTPVTVTSMIEDLEADPGMSILELGTGTGYSAALLSAVFGEDLVTSVEVDPRSVRVPRPPWSGLVGRRGPTPATACAVSRTGHPTTGSSRPFRYAASPTPGSVRLAQAASSWPPLGHGPTGLDWRGSPSRREAPPLYV